MRYLQKVDKNKLIDLDLKDKKILAILESDARTSTSSIAKVAGLGRDVTDYRIKHLEQTGVIQGYRTIIDIHKFGYESYHVFIQLNKPTKDVEESIIKKFQNRSYIRAIIKYSGKYDFELAIIAKNITEFDSILDQTIDDCRQYLESYEVLILTKPYVSRVFPKKFLQTTIPLKIKNSNLDKALLNKNTQGDIKTYSVDNKDLEILKMLSEKPRESAYAISESLKKYKLSHDSVAYRIKNMISSNIITKFIPVINYSSIKYSVYCLLLRISAPIKNQATLKEVLQNDDKILWSVKCVGKYDLIIYLCVSEIDELHDTINTIRNYFPQNIKDYEILLAYEEYKYNYFPDYINI